MRCLIISDTTTHSKYWYYKYVQLLGGRKHTFAPPTFHIGGAPPLLAPPLSTPLSELHAEFIPRKPRHKKHTSVPTQTDDDDKESVGLMIYHACYFECVLV